MRPKPSGAAIAEQKLRDGKISKDEHAHILRMHRLMMSLDD